MSPAWPTVKLVSEPADAPSVLAFSVGRRRQLGQLRQVDVIGLGVRRAVGDGQRRWWQEPPS